MTSQAKPILLRHLSGENIGRFPVWMMRQAGRYLPSYRAVRQQYTFWEMVTRPELAAEVTLQPARQLPVDAAILFSDILTLPYGMGVPIEMRESIGPVVTSPFRTLEDFERFREFDADKHTPFVGEALRRIRAELAPEKALIGFAGAPWTVACYLAGTPGKRSFEGLLRWLHRDPQSLGAALDELGRATTRYLIAQIRAGAQLVQLFDTWVSEVPRWFFEKHYQQTLVGILEVAAKEVPTIYFPRHAHHLLDLARPLPCSVLGVDSLRPLSDVDRVLGGTKSLQGNLDPRTLLADVGIVRKKTRELVAEARTLSRPAILNLGHGILPEVSIDNARAFLEEATTLWI
jgi:uroporphyrinogen decarboxylase